jgi:hypothetical protein
MFASVAAIGVMLASPLEARDAHMRQSCASLKALSTPGFRVETAEWRAAERLSVDPAGTSVDVPDHCLFRAVLNPRPSGIGDLQYGTGIELRLPARWNGRFLFQGGGGLNGVLLPAVGVVSGSLPALARGFAVVSSDTGHRGRSMIDARFGRDQQARLDFAYQAVERTTREAKSLLARYYGRKPDFSYYMGCSTGGREAMLPLSACRWNSTASSLAIQPSISRESLSTRSGACRRSLALRHGTQLAGRIFPVRSPILSLEACRMPC